MKAKDLIAELQKVHPDAEIGVRACCCPFIHDIDTVREPTAEEDLPNENYSIVLNAT